MASSKPGANYDKRKDTEFGQPSGRKAGGVLPTERRAAAGDDLSSADQMRDIYALDSVRDDEKVGEVEIGRREEDGRKAPFNH